MQQLVLRPNFTPRETQIYFGLDELKALCNQKQGIIIVDEVIAKTHGKRIQKLIDYELIAIPNKKTAELKAWLENELFQKQLGRDSLLIAMGGGAVSDLVGFTAATFLRGIPLILIPTTLLAMVDAAIGGKTGIDTPFGKNLIGAFYLPQAIFIDIDLLKTLPEDEWLNGLSEILKMGLVADPIIWEKRIDWRKEILTLIHRSIHAKCKIVADDFEEKKGLRRILNFGHTVGHALELLSNYKMAHGKAVALGTMAESYLSYLLGYLPKKELDQILSFYQKLGYTFNLADPKSFLNAMNRDKKGQNGMARFVLIDQIGHAIPFEGEYCRSVPEDTIHQMIDWMQNHG